MNEIPLVSCIKPEGAFYVLMNLDQIIGKTIHGVTIQDSDDFARVFLETGLVAVVPGTGVGAPNYVRGGYATSMQNIEEGLDRLEEFLAF
jgi:aspartate aminotransferase